MSDTLGGVSRASLEGLRRWVMAGRVDLPLRAAALEGRGVPPEVAECLVGTLGELSKAALIDVLDSLAGERSRADQARPRLLWTGPEGRGARALDTRVQLQKLFRGAQQSVFMAGYGFDDPSLLRPLYDAMCEQPLEVTIVLNIEAPRGDKRSSEQRIRHQVDDFCNHVWPARDLMPRIYVDPRTAAWHPDADHPKGGYFTSMHAKAVVVDGRRCIIGSANFTGRGTMRNIEAGVLLESAEFCGVLLGQWQGLIAAGVLREVELKS